MLGRRLGLAALVAAAACSSGGPAATPPTTPPTVRLGAGAPPAAVLAEVPTAGEVSTVATLDGRLFAVGGQIVEGPGNRYARELRELDPVTGDVLRLVELGEPVDRVAAGHGRLWVLGDGVLTVVDPGSLAVVSTHRLVANGIAFDRSGAWLASANEVVRFTPDGASDVRVPLAGEPTEVVVTGGAVVARVGGDRLARIDRSTLAFGLESWSGGALLGDAGDGWLWTNEDDDLVARRGDKVRQRVDGADPLVVVPDGDGGFAVGGPSLFGRVSADGVPELQAHGSAEVWSVAVVDDVVWAATLGAQLLRLGAPAPLPSTQPVFAVDPARAPAGAVVTARGRGLQPDDVARPLRFVRTGVKPRKVGEVRVRPSGSYAFGVHVDPDLPPGSYHVAFDQRRAGDVEVVRADVGVPYRVLPEGGCLRFDLRTWPVPDDVAAGTFTLVGPDRGVLDGGVEVVAGPCG